MAITQTFSETPISGVNVNNPTSLQIGPDGRLYVAQQNGIVKVYDLTVDGNGWQASGEQIIGLVQDVPNHDDNGDLNSNVNGRQVTGLSVWENAQGEIELYVTSSDPRIGAGGGGNDVNLDTNSGIISRLTFDDATGSWDKTDLVIGLPRSEENHSTNGLAIRVENVDGEDRVIAYVASGGFDNKGAPSNNFAYTPEYYYSGAILRVDITALETMEAGLLAGGGLNGGTSYVDSYVYALPTLDDPTRANSNGLSGDGAQDGADIDDNGTVDTGIGVADAAAADTFGGNDGRNQAKFDADGPVQIYSAGYRNHYDIAITPDGNIYSFDNGPNNGWGDEPIDANGDVVTSTAQIATNAPDTLNDGSDPTSNDSAPDNLHLVTEGFYAGHANPTRASGADAGLWSGGGDGLSFETQLTDPNDPANDPTTVWDDLPADWGTINGDLDNPQEGVWISPGGSGATKGPDGSLFKIGSSSNGLTAYSAEGITDNTGAEVLAVASFNGNITFMEIASDGTQAGSNVTASSTVFVGGTPLDIWAIGQTGIDGAGTGAGSVVVAKFGANAITVLEPGNPVGPDVDADDDGILDEADPLQFDPANGTDVGLAGGETLFWDLNPGDAGVHPEPDGPYNIGMTGWMIDGSGEINPDTQIDDPSVDLLTDLDNTIRGGAPGIFQIKTVTEGTALGTANTQNDALQAGFSPDLTVQDFTLRAPILNPFSSSANNDVLFAESASMGVSLGDGSQNNFLGVFVTATNPAGDPVAPAIRVVHEEADTILVDQIVDATTLAALAGLASATVDADQIELFLKVDMTDLAAITVQAQIRYQENGAFTTPEPIAVGQPITLASDSALAQVLRGENTVEGQPSATVLTMLAASAGAADAFTADFLDVEVSSTAFPATTIENVTTQAELDASEPTRGVDTVDYDGSSTLTVPEGYENLELSDNANDGATVTMNSGDNLVAAGSGAHTVNLGGGSDTVTGTAGDLDGDTIGDFAEDDNVVLQGATGAQIVSAVAGSAIIGIDTTGDGVADTTITFAGDVDPASIVATDDGTDLVLTLDPVEIIRYRVNAGGQEVAAQDDGPAWSADTATNNSVYLSDPGSNGTASFAAVEPGATVPSTTPGVIFDTERWDAAGGTEMAWAFDAEPGTYEVRLYLGNGFSGTSAAGARIFDVSIEGAIPTNLDDVDLSGQFGHQVGAMISNTVTVNDGTLNLAFLHGVENPLINGIEIIQIGGTPPADTTDPTVGSIEAVAALETPGNDLPIDVSVVINDETGVDVDSINTAALTASAGTVSSATIAGVDGDPSVSVVFQVDAPSGGWPIGEEITFTVDGITDTSGNAIAPANDSLTFLAAPTPGEVLYRVNTGGPELAAADGSALAWAPDTGTFGDAGNNEYLTALSTGTSTFDNSGTNGVAITSFDAGIAASAPDALFDTERYDPPTDPAMQWSFPVADGDYVVNLFFAEIFTGITAAGERVFDVAVEGSVPATFNAIDQYATAGPGSAYMLSETVTVTDGVLDLEFLHGFENPAIKGIEIVAAGTFDGSTVSIAPPTPATVEETGDTGSTPLVFPVTFDTPPGENVTVEYAVDINGTLTTGLTQPLGQSDGAITVNVANDDLANGPEDVTVTLTGIALGTAAAIVGTASAGATVSEDDTAPGQVVVAINAGGPALTQDGIDFTADQYSSTGLTYTDNTDGNGEQTVFDGTVYETERYGDPFSYEVPVEAGIYDVELHFAEIFQSTPGARVFDVLVEGQTVLEDFDMLAETGDINTPLVKLFEDIDPATAGNAAAIDIQFQVPTDTGVDNAKVSGIVIRDASVPAPTGGAATLTVNDGADGIETSNFGNGSFSITNAGTKDISFIEIDVTDALLPDAVFDPFGLAGDQTGKIFTLNGDDGGTGLITPTDTDGDGNPYDEDAVGEVYIGTGGAAGYETIRLAFSDFNPGETVSFGVDMDPNSIAGAQKSTLDSGAQLDGAGQWDVGGIGGGELAGSTFTVGYSDATSSVGKLHGQGTGSQMGSEALSSQDSPNLAVNLTVNGLTEGAEGTYADGGPEILIEGPAGETARVLVAKGFIVPFTNEFPDTNGDTFDPVKVYHDRLDQQMQALEASGFPANNMVEMLYVDVELTGAVQDISGLFDFSQVAAFDLSVPDQTNEFGTLVESQLPLGIMASVVDPANDQPKGPVTSPIHLTFAENAAPTIDPVADVEIDEFQEANFAVSASDAENDPITLSAAVTRDVDGTPVDPSAYSFVDNGDGTASFSWATGEADDGTYTVTLTADDGSAQTTQTVALRVDETAVVPGTVLYRVNAGGQDAAAGDGGAAWSADTQANNSPYLVNPGSNNVYPNNGTPKPGVDLAQVADTAATAEVVGIERWDNTTDANGEMAWSFDVPAGTEVEVRLYLAELFTGLPDLDGSGDPTGDRIFDVSVDGVIPVAFDDLDPYSLGGNAFDVASVVSHTVTSDGAVDLAFLHVSENPAIKGIELLVAGEPDNAGPTATLVTAPDVSSPGSSYQFAVEFADDSGVDVESLDGLDVTITGGGSFTATAGLVSVDVSADGTPRTATYEIAPPAGTWDPGDNGTYTIALKPGEVADIFGNTAAGEVLGTFEVAVPQTKAAALIEITPGGGLDASTFSSNSFQITNTSDTGAQITSVSVDLSSGVLPDMVFDPTGSGGDATASPFTPNSGSAETGIVAPTDPALDPFSQPRNGGFDVLTIDFTDFDPGEQFQFTTDVDPNSIQGVDGAGQAGAVSGYELIGSTVTVTFSDGRTVTGTLYEDGSLGGGQALLDSEVTAAAPTIELVGAGGDEAPLPGSQITVTGTEQVVRVTGTAGEYVSLLQMDARLYIASGDPAFDVSAEELPFYANEAVAGKSLYTGQIGADGFVDIPVSLLETDGGTTPDGGLNHFVAVTSPTPYAVGQPTSPTSNTLVVKQGAPLVYDVPTLTTFDGTDDGVIEIPHAPEFEIPEGTLAFSFTAADVSGDQGLVGKDASGFTGGGNHFLLYLNGDTLVARFQDGSASALLEVPGIVAGQAYEVAATFGPEGVELWLDGNLVGTDALVMDWTQNAEYLQWGGRGWASSTGEAGFDAPFEGTMADRQIYSAKLDASEIAALAATATGANNRPVAEDDPVSVDEDNVLVIDTTTLLANDTDEDGDTLSVSAIATAPANGTAVLDTAGNTITYTPNLDFNGTDSFTITVSDGQGGFDDATVTVTVAPVNDAPVAVDDLETTILDTPVTIDVLDNDSDVDGDPLTVATLGAPTSGTVVDNGDGTVTYTPQVGTTGTATFTYTAGDGAGGTSETATVMVEVLAAPNTPPLAVADAVTAQEDGSVTFQPGSNDTDDDGDTVVASAIAAAPANGTAVVETDGTVTYTPNVDFNGADSFEVTVTDGRGGFATASANVTVDPVNDAPMAVDDTATTGQAAPVVIDLLDNDSDVDGDPLAIVAGSLSAPGNGTIVDNGNGTVTYTPNEGFAGDDSFDYSVTDGTETATASVNVTVTSFPEPLVESLGETQFDGSAGSVIELPHDPIYEIPQGTVAFSFTANYLSGDQGLFAKDASGFGGGGNHFVAYLDGGTLKARFQDSATSAVIEVAGLSAGQPYDVAATFGPEGVALWLDGALVGESALVMDWTQNVEYLQWGGRGWASQSDQPGFDAPFDGVIADRQIYDVALTESQIEALHSGAPANIDPVAVDDLLVVDEDSSIAFDPTSNDTDIDSTGLLADQVASLPANGMVTIALDGTVTYVPEPDFFGQDSFDLLIADGDGGFDTSTATVTVNGIEDAPVATDDLATVQVDESAVIDLLENDSDADGDSLQIVDGSLGAPANGTVTDNGDGTVTYTPNAGYTGGDSFGYTLTDGTSTASADVNVTVMEAPTLPEPVFEQPGVSTFSGSSGDVANYAPDAVLEIPAGTIAFSFIADDPADQQGLVVKDAGGFVGGGNHFAAFLDNSDLNVRFQDGSSSQSFTFDNVVAGQEYEVAAVFENGGGVGLYVDGTLVGEDTTFTMNWESNQEYLQVGGLGWASSTGGSGFIAPFEGQIADVEIFDKALDQDIIQSLSEESAFDWAV